MEDAAVGVQGLNELLASFKLLGKELPRELSAGLRSVAVLVANDARSIAEANGLRDSGDLIAGITTSVRGTTAWIVDNATRVSPKYPEGYPYPAVYEYGGRKQGPAHGFAKHEVGEWGPRSFIHPAIERDQDKVIDELEVTISRVISHAGF